MKTFSKSEAAGPESSGSFSRARTSPSEEASGDGFDQIFEGRPRTRR